MLMRFPKRTVEISPVTRNEARKKAALRFAASATYGEETYFLDIRCLYFSGLKDDIELVVKGERGKLPLKVSFRSRIKIASPDETRSPAHWYEEQYIVELPADFGTVYADCRQISTGHALVHTRADKSLWNNALIARYYEQIKNPFADDQYEDWLYEHRLTVDQIILQRKETFEQMPLMSLVSPVYCTPPEYLHMMIDSVLMQTYANWELVIVNACPSDEDVQAVLAQYKDERIRVIDHPENDGINGNTNCGIAACKGDFIGFIDHDDWIEPDLLYEYVKAINEHDGVDLLYCDEDSFEEGDGFKLALFKPDANLDLLYSNNYVVHLLMVSRSIIEQTKRSGSEVNGAQDYDLTLQAFRLGESIIHVPKTLYHWRVHELSTNDGNTGAKPYTNKTGARALEIDFKRRGIEAKVEETDVPYAYRCTFATTHSRDDIAIITDCDSASTISTRNEKALNSSAKFLFFASPCTEIERETDFETMLGYFERKEVGMVAPRLVCPDGLVAQTGLVLRRNLDVTYMGQGLLAQDGGYADRFHRPCNFTAVSGDCCMLKQKDFAKLGGYDEAFETPLYAHIDLCLRYRKKNKLIVYTPFVTLEHAQEIINPVGELTPEQLCQIGHDKALLQEKWPDIVGKPDPLFNPSLDETNPYFVLKY